MRGNVVDVILEARDLGVFCRPCSWSHEWPGEALRLDGDYLERVTAFSNNHLGIFVPTVNQILQPWELTTMGKLKVEYERSITDPSPF